jgi:hypothetical protein
MKSKIIILLLPIVVLNSCTFQKRLYRKGFYIDFKQNKTTFVSRKNPPYDNTINTITTLPVFIDTNKFNDNVTINLRNKSIGYSFLSFTHKKYSTSFSSFNLDNHPSFYPNFILQNNKNFHSESNLKINSVHPDSSFNNFITRHQLIAIVFQLLIGLLVANYYMFFYLNPFHLLPFILLGIFILSILIPSYFLLLLFRLHFTTKNTLVQSGKYKV